MDGPAGHGKGLTKAEAARRLAEEGANVLPRPPLPGLANLFLAQLREPLSLVLLAAAILSGLLLREYVDAIAILAIVVLNASIGSYQQQRANHAVESLRQFTTPRTHAWRDGKLESLPSAEVVRGDLIDLSAGDRVPADAEVQEAFALGADESMLTGESHPVEKQAGGSTQATVPLGERTGLLYAGTLVVRGRATATVRATGGRTEMGRIAAALGRSPPPPLEVELRRVTARVSAAALAVGSLVVVLAILRAGLRTDRLLEAVLTGIALAVAAVPEGLLAIVTAALALGAQRMARHGAIVRELRSIESIGAASVLCVDKTGTLTQGRLAVGAARPVPGHDADLWAAALRCNDAKDDEGDPIDVALRVEAERHRGALGPEVRMRELPFDPVTRSMTTVHATPSGPMLTIKGAPEVVFDRCRSGPSTDWARAETEALARKGLRVLAFADGSGDDLMASDLRPLGLVAFHDPVRASARDAVALCRRAGIQVVMVTGDHLQTARAVAEHVGLDPARAVSSVDLAGLAPAERSARLRSAQVVARVEPSIKVELVEAHRAAGHVVAMMGDGVNDAPALRRADVGVAVAGAGGTDVAREAAGLILTQGDLGTLVEGVRQGRTIYRNLRSVIAYLLAGNASEVIVVLAGLFLFPELTVPLLPVQLLWINLVTDGLPAVALGLDRPPGDPLEGRPRGRGQSLLSWRTQTGLLSRGSLAAGAVLLTALWARAHGGGPGLVQSQLLLSLVVVHMSLAYVSRADTVTFGAGWHRNRALLAGVVGSIALQALIFESPSLRTIFGLAPVSWLEWAWAFVAAAFVVLVVDAARILHRFFSRTSTGRPGGAAGTPPRP